MKDSKRLVPELRFPDFDDDWEKKRLGDIATKIGSGSTPKGGVEVYTATGIPFIRSQNVIDNQLKLDKVHIPLSIHKKMKGSKVLKNDILLNITAGSIGRSCVVPINFKEGNVNQHVSIIRLPDNNPQFLQLILSSATGQKLIFQSMTGSGREGLNFKSIRDFKISLPSQTEQQKIANFLTAIDKRIQTLEKKKTLLEQYKKGVMQKIFSQEIRFRDDDGKAFGDWAYLKLNDIAERVRTKNKIDHQNVLTISAQLGLVSQLEYFNKSVSSKNLTNYYLIERNDFAYNKSYSKGYPMGAIKRLEKYDYGVVSTLYICFRFNNKVSLDFMVQYFNSGLQNKEIEKVAQEGARNHGLLNIGVDDFFDIKLKLPCNSEQIKIANFLTAIDKKVELVNQQIEHSKEYKKGLLQKMFV